MEHNEAVELVTRLVCRFRRVDAAIVDPEADLVEALGFDSLDAAELVAAIHQETGVELGVGSFQDLRTVDGIARMLSEGSTVS